MSPAWADTVRLQLGAQGLRAARHHAWWRGGGAVGQGGAAAVSLPTPLPVSSGADLAAAVAAAAQACGARPGQRADWLLSGDWVQLQLAGQAARLRGRAECDAAARHHLQRVYGDAVQGWCVRSDRLGDDGLLCAGIEQRLLDDLAAATAAAGLRMGRCMPQLTWAWNQLVSPLRGRLWAHAPDQGWLLVLEAGRGTLLGLVQQLPRVLQTQRLQAQDLAGQLAQWRQRCSLQHGLHHETPGGAPDPDAPCLVVACDAPPAAVPGATVRSLSWLG